MRSSTLGVPFVGYIKKKNSNYEFVGNKEIKRGGPVGSRCAERTFMSAHLAHCLLP
jgi:ribosomal protein S27AE